MKAQTRIHKLSILLMIPVLLLAFVPPSNAATFDCNQPMLMPQQECEALVDLYNSTNGDTWSVQDGWLVDPDACNWHGVECNEFGHVIKIVLDNNNLEGNFSADLTGLSIMYDLNLSENQLEGDLSSIVTLMPPMLNHMDLGWNNISGTIPPNISNLFDLWYLDLEGNQLVGDLPTVISYLPTGLESLYLGANGFTGIIPDSLAGFPNLRYLDLTANSLEEDLSTAINKLPTYLISIGLGHNQFYGTVPESIADFSNLTSLFLTRNLLSGDISPVISSLPSGIDKLGLAENNFNGTLDASISKFSNLRYLDLDTNNLDGDVGIIIDNLPNSMEILSLGRNNFIGTIPESVSNFSNLQFLNIRENPTYGDMKTIIDYLPAGIETLWIGGNGITGTIPETISRLSNLKSFTPFGNELTGDLETILGYLPLSIDDLLLGGNYFTGTIPDSISDFTYLQNLDLQGNPLSGPIPLSIMTLPLKYFTYNDTYICEPDDVALLEWLESIPGLQRTNLSCSDMQYPITCVPGTSISGMIYEADGITPIDNAAIRFLDPATGNVLYQTETYPDGSYGCGLPDGDYILYAWARNARYSREFYNNQYIIDDSNVVSVIGGIGSTNIDFVFNLPRTSFEQFTFNHSEGAHTSDRVVREAIAYGTNRQQFVDLFYQYDSYVMDSYELRGFWAYADTGLPQYGYFPDLARDTLTDAGWEDTDGDNIRDKDNVPLHIDYYYPDNSSWPDDRALQASLFKADMAAIGIDVTIHTFTDRQSLVESQDFDILAFTWINMYTGMGLGDLYYTSDPYDFYSGNWGYYSNTVADQYWDQAVAATTMNDKLPWLHAHQIEIMTDLAILPLYQRCEYGDSDCDMVVDLIDVCPHDSTDTCNQSNSTAELVDEDGGTVTTEQGSVEVNIPSGALDTTTPISVTDIGHGFVLETDVGESAVVMGVELGPEGQTFNAPVEVILSWEDTEVPGFVDGTNINEGDLFISKDGEAITGLCSEEPIRCDQTANTFTVEVEGFSQFVLATLLEVELGEITAPSKPVPVGELVEVSASFTNYLPPEAYTATWDWGDGNSSSGTIGQGSVNGSHTYAEAGVYIVTLTLTDGINTDTATYQYIVVYDPDGGFVTGGGWIDSPAGAYLPDPALTGKATFGFVSKYKKGAFVPEGNTEFQFKVADLNFKSTNYQWLVITGKTNAQFKGIGSIKGEGDYKFMIWANDGETDTFRIKIWEEDEFGVETVIYDNGSDQPIEGGSIVVHAK